MPAVRLTLVCPKPGAREDVLAALEQLDDYLGAAPGLLMSLVIRDHEAAVGAVGRLAVWDSPEASKRESSLHGARRLRSYIRALSSHVLVDDILDAASGWTTGIPFAAPPASVPQPAVVGSAA